MLANELSQETKDDDSHASQIKGSHPHVHVRSYSSSLIVIRDHARHLPVFAKNK